MIKTASLPQLGIIFNALIGHASKWLVLVMPLCILAVVALRYIWGIGAINLQELSLYAFATSWWLCTPLVLEKDGHVRVDIFYRHYTERRKRLTNTVGHLLLLAPTGILLAWLSLDYISISWSMKESSSEPGGLPWVYYLKTLLGLGPSLMVLQALCLSLGAHKASRPNLK